MIVTMMRQVAGDYIARDIACAAPDARIVIIATQVRCSMQQFCRCLHTVIPAKIFCYVLTHRRHHHHHPLPFSPPPSSCYSTRCRDVPPPQSTSLPYAANESSSPAPSSAHKLSSKRRASPPLRASSSCTPLHLTATRRHCAPVCSTTCGLCSKASSFAAKCVLVCLPARLVVVWSRRSLACFTH